MVKRKELIPVCGLVVMLVYGWSLYRFLYILPSWLKFLKLSEVFSLLSYTFVVNLIDSILVVASLVVLAFLLPRKWIRDDFILRGGLSGLMILLSAMYLAFRGVRLEHLPVYFLGNLILLIVLQLVFGRVQGLRTFIEAVADRSVIFLYIYIPLSLVGLIGVIWRSLGSI